VVRAPLVTDLYIFNRQFSSIIFPQSRPSMSSLDCSSLRLSTKRRGAIFGYGARLSLHQALLTYFNLVVPPGNVVPVVRVVVRLPAPRQPMPTGWFLTSCGSCHSLLTFGSDTLTTTTLSSDYGSIGYPEGSLFRKCGLWSNLTLTDTKPWTQVNKSALWASGITKLPSIEQLRVTYFL